MKLVISLLGPLRVELAGRPVEVDTRKALALLAYLALTGETQNRATLAALLWSDYDDANARAALRRTLSVLNKALDGQGVSISRDSVSLDALAVAVDVSRARDLVSQCANHGHAPSEVCPACVPLLAEAAALHRGELLAGFVLRDAIDFEDWQAAQAEELRRELDTTLSRLVRACAEAGRFEDAISHARRRLAIDPLNESAHQALMRLYALSGDRAASLRQYRDCVRVLDEELGVQPLEDTTALYQAILAKPPAQPSFSLEREAAVARTPEALTAALPLAGRERELTALSAAVSQLGVDGRVVFIEGEAGIGKTRLVGELARLVDEEGGTSLVAHCYEGEADLAFGPIVTLLRQSFQLPGAATRLAALPDATLVEVGRILTLPPQLRPGLPPPPALESPAAQSRFFAGLEECISTSVGGSGLGLIVLEDLHWCDEASLDFLSYVARRLQARRLLLALTWRSEELEPEHRLQRLLIERQREAGALHLTLSRLDADSVRGLVEGVYGSNRSDLAARLFQETEGLPFFLAQYVANSPETPTASLTIPAGVGDLMRSRVSRLGDLDRQVLSAAAVIGRSFSFDLVREVSGRPDEDAVGALEGLVRHGFLHVAVGRFDDQQYDFTHEKLRSFVYEETGPARRQLLHRRVAETLTRLAGRRLGAVAAQAANHHRAAGQLDRAAECFMLAGDQARGVRAFAEALSHYESAVSCGFEPAGEAHRQIGDLHTLAGAYGSALTSYQTAASLADRETLPELEHKIGGLYLRLGSWRLAEEHFVAALSDFREQGRTAEMARVQTDRALTAYREGDTPGGKALAEEARALAESGGDHMALAQAENILGILASGGDELDAAIDHLQTSLSLADELEAADAQVAVLNNLAIVLRRRGDFDHAERSARSALEVCVRLGDRHREAAILNNLADLLRAAGREDESMEQLKAAVTIFSEIGGVSGDMEPEVWKLVEW